jgi:hypothetical protein
MVAAEPNTKGSDVRRSRIRIVALVVVASLAAACNEGSTVASGVGDTGTGSPPVTTPPADSASSTASPPTSSPKPSLEDGRHFVYAVSTKQKRGSSQLRFDLAYFLTGHAATKAAKDHGDEHPPPNDYYIVNDNPLLRWLPVSPTVHVRYIPTMQCCDLVMGDYDAWAASIAGTMQTDYPGKDVPWWITVSGGQIVKIEQQYLP